MDFPELLDKTSEAMLEILHEITPDQFENPTPCEDWNVKQLLNHMIGSFKIFTARAKGEQPPERQEIYAENFEEAINLVQQTAKEVVEAWKLPGALERKIQTQIGEVKGEFQAGITVNEFLVHGWDLSKATNQKMEIDDKTAGQVLELAEERMKDQPQVRGRAFGPELPSSKNASNLNRLASFLGRQV